MEKNKQFSNGTGLNRREFISFAGTAAAGFIVTGANMPVMAGPFGNDYLKVIPADKKLEPAWVRSLYERGRKQVYTDPKALGRIGMPVGGLFAGTVYLSGDGRLWLWDIFNRDQEGIVPRKVDCRGSQISNRHGANYIEPAPVVSPFKQGFALRTGDKTRSLDMKGFSDITFDGRYPIGRVTYRDPDCPVRVVLDAFSPFIPLNADDSSLPATVMRYTITNTSNQRVSAELVGHLQNAVCQDTGDKVVGRRRNRVVREAMLTAIECLAEPGDADNAVSRPDIVFEDFEKPTYAGWTVEGTAFGEGPIRIADIPEYQGDVAGKGQRVVNSHASAPGEEVRARDQKTGTLRSRPFTIERKTIQFLVGGGAHKGRTCVNLLIDGKVVVSTTGKNNNRMERTFFNVEKYEGKQAQLQVVDEFSGGWGNIGIDEVVFSDRPLKTNKLQEQRDFGTMTLTLLGRTDTDHAMALQGAGQPMGTATGSLQDERIGSVGRKSSLEPGQTRTVTFVVTWHFPNFYGRGVNKKLVGHYYASRFESALDVARYIAANESRLVGDTQKWVETWYDSTLPWWLLDRSMANTSTLATTTCYRFKDGRFWAWEGIGCCPGTCTHVWHYAQAPGRLFPEVERNVRERVDFGLSMHADGGIGMRAHLTGGNHPAHDGQCGRILGAYREHQMSADMSFLENIWPQVKKAVEYLMRLDGNDDGLIEGAQPNTLDAAWYGKVSFLQSLYLAALKAGEAMAMEMGDAAFAKRCGRIAGRGAKTIEELYNGEYFVQVEDAAHKNKIGVGPGCYIDQIFGQSWAHQVALGRLFDKEKQLSALRSLWKYNFVPDVGPFRDRFKQGRWYAMAGDAGLVMCTWPKGGQNPNFEKHWQYQYFNECMTGFEWQAASHMIWEGMLKEGLAVSRAIHDRYNAALRNPYNEIECSDHYARAMASYGTFIATCGFECHGPKGHIGFAPRLNSKDFKAAFTTAQAWGTIRQQRTAAFQKQEIEVKWGTLKLKSFAFEIPQGKKLAGVKIVCRQRPLLADFEIKGARLHIVLKDTVTIMNSQSIRVNIDFV